MKTSFIRADRNHFILLLFFVVTMTLTACGGGGGGGGGGNVNNSQFLPSVLLIGRVNADGVRSTYDDVTVLSGSLRNEYHPLFSCADIGSNTVVTGTTVHWESSTSGQRGQTDVWVTCRPGALFGYQFGLSWDTGNIALALGENRITLDTFEKDQQIGRDVVTVILLEEHTVGGTLSGLNGGSVVLQLNGSDDLTLSTNGSFSFGTGFRYGAIYDVSLLSQPAGQICTIDNGSGTVAASDVDNVTVTCISDDTAPTASILFPPPHTATGGDSIVVRGTASDTNEITILRVNGIDAISTDNFKTWQATIGLSSGENTLVVETGDIALNADMSASSVQINSVGADIISSPAGIAFDSANNRALVTDTGLNALVSVDLASGARTVVSDSSTPDSVSTFVRPTDIIFDSANNRALVVDTGLDAIVSVDMASGARTILSDGSTPDSVNALVSPSDIALDSANNRVLVIDVDLDALIAVDLASGARSIVSDSSTPNSINAFVSPLGIALDGANNRALVTNSNGINTALISVDLTTGSRTIVSNSSIPDAVNEFSSPRDIALDSANNRALVTDSGLFALVSVDLSSGARTIVSSLGGAIGVALDSANNRALLVSPGADALVSVNLTSGARRTVSTISTPDAVNAFFNPRGVVFDTANNRALVTDSGLNALVSVDLISGARTIVSDSNTPDSVNAFVSPTDIVLDSANNRVLVTDAGIDALVSVDMASGARTIVSDSSTPDSVNAFEDPSGVALDSANNRALVIDAGIDALVSVDLSGGTRTIVSDSSTPDSMNAFVSPSGIALDSANNRALVIDQGNGIDQLPGALIAVDLYSGARTKIYSSSIIERFSSPRDLAFDSANNRALVVFAGLDTLAAVNLDTGVRTIVSDNSIPDPVNGFEIPLGVALDSANNRALVIDAGLDALIAVDLANGQRVIWSR